MSDMKENCIEWITGSDRITATLSQQRFITRVKKLALNAKNNVDYVENSDGTIVAHLPLKALKLNIINATGRGFAKKGDEYGGTEIECEPSDSL